MDPIPDDKIMKIGSVLNDEKIPLQSRFRALFALRNIGGSCAIECISQCFKDPSVLLKHELAYCLGQMKDKNALPVLISVLKDKTEDPMVRHEAGEAIGAIGCNSVLSILEEFSSDPAVEVAETCQLAKNRIKWLHSLKDDKTIHSINPYETVDPAPPADDENVSRLRAVLLDDNADLFARYRAMFALRNLRSEESIIALCEGLYSGGALFRHEIAFVLGQLQSEMSVPYLTKALDDKTQNEMVRHECAEALGIIATPECMEILQRYLHDDKRVVRESCQIGLDICEYENSSDIENVNTILDRLS